MVNSNPAPTNNSAPTLYELTLDKIFLVKNSYEYKHPRVFEEC